PLKQGMTCVICKKPASQVRMLSPELIRSIGNILATYAVCRDCLDDPDHLQKAEAIILGLIG
ncbi:MAG TPA: hypothetical protein PLR48_07115, partial [Bacillota bacterium]|nr:hypothetical protein [Bacillota bacterium]